MIETERLILRRWSPEDAQVMFDLCKDPDIGPAAGWSPHKNIDESRYIIENVLSGSEAYAICFKEDEDKPIGCIELKMHSDLAETDDECEFGYWLGFYDGNNKSERVCQKLGFKHQWTNP